MDFKDLQSQLEDIEYSSFSLAIRKDFPEEEFKFHREGLSLSEKTLLNQQLRVKLSKLLGKPWSPQGDIQIIVDYNRDQLSFKINPLFIFVHYNKFSRELSQTRWVKYTSVEDFIVEAANELFRSSNAFLHGAGREDVDVLMLGDGRPAVIEIQDPKVRSVPLDKFSNLVETLSKGKVKLNNPKWVSSEWVAMIKEAKFDKTYRAKVEFEKEPSKDELSKILSIDRVNQRTPLRVKHRRADLVRKRRIYSIKYLSHNGLTYDFEIFCESGTYIKELISGDYGRTQPSFSSVSGIPARCVQLDVIKVHDYISNWW